MAVISPDGKFYAYALNERDEFKNSLWLGQTDGSNDLPLRPADDNLIRGAAFSPDSKTLYYALGSTEESPGGLFSIHVLGGIGEKLLDKVGNWFTLSPDGQQLAFFRASKEANAFALVITNLDGTDERELLTRPPARNFVSRSAAWSADGSLLAVAAYSDSLNQSCEIFIVKVKDGSIDQLTALEWSIVHNLVWLRDGQGLIVVAMDRSEAFRHLWLIDYPKGRAHRLSSDTDSYGSPLSISADGSSLLALKVHRESNIWIAPANDLSKARQVTFSSLSGMSGWNGFDWTPEGSIVFTAGVDRSVAIYSMEADGSNIKQLTSEGFFDRRPSVTGDGRFIVFQSNRSEGNEIWRVQRDGSDLRRLTTGGGNTNPDPTPDGKWVVYTSTRDGKSFVWRISIEGGDPVRLTDKDSFDPRVSYDGKLIACGYRADDEGPLQLALVNTEDGITSNLFDVPLSANFTQGVRWTPDGKAVCYRDWANGIWRQDLNGGPPRRLKGLPEEKLYTFSWSRDGKLFAYTRGREISDAILIKDPN